MADNREDTVAAELRSRAVERIGTSAPSARNGREPSLEEALRLVHELQVHQVELEMQNEELRRAREELEASRTRYFELYDLAPVGYLTLNAEGAILEANLTAAALLGVARSVLAGQPFSRFVLPDDRDTWRRQHALLGTEGAQASWEMRMLRADGSPCWVHLRAALVQGDERRITLNDINQRKRAEASLALAEARMQHLQKAQSLERMAGAIAHHFNNKLHVVMGNLELATGDASLGARPAGLLKQAMQAAVEAAEVSTLMLTFLGPKDESRAPLDLSQACRWTLPLLRASLPVASTLESDLPEPGPIVRAHADRIQQVLVNLVANAGEAVGSGVGEVRLSVATVAAADIPEAHRFPVDWEPQDAAYACLKVQDNGRGIAEKDLDRIFDPFFSGKDSGRGLGLSVVLGVARAHGGAVAVSSEPGRGSTFSVYLPLSAQQGSPPGKKDAVSVAGGAVLLVEDEPLVLRVSSAVLKGLGFPVLEARDGFEAVELLGRDPAAVRLVLCDLSMPGMNGWETLAALRKLVPGIPAILTSGYDKAQVMADPHLELPQAFLRKPYSSGDLFSAIRLALADRPTPV